MAGQTWELELIYKELELTRGAKEPRSPAPGWRNVSRKYLL